MVIQGASNSYRLQQGNGYVMWHLVQVPAGYNAGHITMSDDNHSIIVWKWDHLTLQNGVWSDHTYFQLKGTSYQFLRKSAGIYETPPAPYLALTQAYVYDLQLLGKLTHSQDFKANQERLAAERQAAAAAAEADRSAREQSFLQELAAKRAAGKPAWGK